MKIKKYLKFKSEKTQVFLEIGSSFIKLVIARVCDGESVYSLIKEEISSSAEEQISAQLKDIFNSHKLPKRGVFLNIPRNLVVARFLNLPSTDDKEIKDMVNIEALKQIPYKGEDIITGHKVIERLTDGYSDVLFAAAENEIINRFVNILQKSGIKPEKIVLSSESLLLWSIGLIEKAKLDSSGTIALINVDSGYIDIDIVEEKKLKFSRAFLSEPASEGEAVVQIKKSLDTYQRQKDHHINRIIISGAKERIDKLLPLLTEVVSITTEAVAQVDSLALSSKGESNLNDTSFLGLLGLSLRPEEVEINLLPQSMIEDNQLNKLRRDFSKIFILAVLIGLISGAIATKETVDKSRRLKAINSKLQAISPIAIKAMAMRENVKVIKRELQQRPLAVEVLAEVYKSAQANLQLNLFDYRRQESLVLRGSAPSLNVIIAFVSKLDESDYFYDVKIGYTRKRATPGNKLTDFEIISNLSQGN